jgi:hypothetical protein
MNRNLAVSFILVYLDAGCYCRASEQDPVMDIQYCLEHKLNTINCKLGNVVSPIHGL